MFVEEKHKKLVGETSSSKLRIKARREIYNEVKFMLELKIKLELDS
jgi:hypothetical protein